MKAQACKDAWWRFPVKGGACSRRFDDVTGVEKSSVAKRINGKKAKEKYFIITNKYALPQTSNAWMFAMFKNFIHSQLLKPIFLSPNHCETQITKNYQTLEWTSFTVVQYHLLQLNYLYYHLVLTAQHKISVLATLVRSSNLRNQAPLFTELCFLQGTLDGSIAKHSLRVTTDTSIMKVPKNSLVWFDILDPVIFFSNFLVIDWNVFDITKKI